MADRLLLTTPLNRFQCKGKYTYFHSTKCNILFYPHVIPGFRLDWAVIIFTDSSVFISL